MRRFAIVLAFLGLLVAAPGPKASPVTNPVGADLDVAGHILTNVGNLSTTNGATVSGDGFAGSSFVVLDDADTPTIFILIAGGPADPSVAPPSGNNQPGSLYLQQSGGAGVLWLKTGVGITDWHRVVTAP